LILCEEQKALITCHSNQNISQLHDTTNCTLWSMDIGNLASLQASLLTMQLETIRWVHFPHNIATSSNSS